MKSVLRIGSALLLVVAIIFSFALEPAHAADLTNYVGDNTHKGSKESIHVKEGGLYIKVGSGDVKDFSQSMMEFKGHIKFLSHDEDFDLSLALTDKNPGAKSGPCSVKLTGRTSSSCTYQVNGNYLDMKLDIDGASRTLMMDKYKKVNTEIVLKEQDSGKTLYKVHLIPSKRDAESGEMLIDS